MATSKSPDGLPQNLLGKICHSVHHAQFVKPVQQKNRFPCSLGKFLICPESQFLHHALHRSIHKSPVHCQVAQADTEYTPAAENTLT